MPEKIYLIQPDDELQPVTEQDYSSETILIDPYRKTVLASMMHDTKNS